MSPPLHILCQEKLFYYKKHVVENICYTQNLKFLFLSLLFSDTRNRITGLFKRTYSFHHFIKLNIMYALILIMEYMSKNFNKQIYQQILHRI